MEHIIYDDTDTTELVETIGAECPEYSENEIFDRMSEELDIQLEDERINLDIELNTRIVAIADIGRWNGRFQGYKIVGHNVRDCLYSKCDYCKWFVDDSGNLQSTNFDHDGTTYIVYRALKPELSETQIVNFLDKLYYGSATPETIRQYTVRLGDKIGDVYGWKFSGRRPKNI